MVDERVARRSAVPGPATFRGAVIGATALVHGMAVVTRNVNDFGRFDDLAVVNAWT